MREEYFELLPQVRRVTEQLETLVRYQLRDIVNGLREFEKIVVKSRVKDCVSALNALQRRQEGKIFDPDKAYTLTNLKDLAGVRVLAFPSGRLIEIDSALQIVFSDWTADPVIGDDGETLAHKYHGRLSESDRITAEYQIVSVLTGLFWEVEHSAIYKPTPHLLDVAAHPDMQGPVSDVHRALRQFEEEFERLSKLERRP